MEEQKRFTLRQAGAEDLAQLAKLFNEYRVYYGQASDVEAGAAFLAERLERKESVVFLALTPEGEAAGFTQLYPSFSSVSARRLWILNDLYVGEAYRGAGAATQLMREAENFARVTGAKGLTLTTRKDNLTAQRLYEGLGYVREETFYTYDFDFES